MEIQSQHQYKIISNYNKKKAEGKHDNEIWIEFFATNTSNLDPTQLYLVLSVTLNSKSPRQSPIWPIFVSQYAVTESVSHKSQCNLRDPSLAFNQVHKNFLNSWM
jgi:hypothetical protein